MEVSLDDPDFCNFITLVVIMGNFSINISGGQIEEHQYLHFGRCVALVSNLMKSLPAVIQEQYGAII